MQIKHFDKVWTCQIARAGANPNRFRCGGTGSKGALAAPIWAKRTNILDELKAIVDRPSERLRSAPKRQSESVPERQRSERYKTLGDQACPLCGVLVRSSRLERHVNERCPKRKVQQLKVQQRKPVIPNRSPNLNESSNSMSATETSETSAATRKLSGRMEFDTCTKCGVIVLTGRRARHRAQYCLNPNGEDRYRSVPGGAENSDAPRVNRYLVARRIAGSGRSRKKDKSLRIVQGGLLGLGKR